jgi:hypothetical protein
MTALYQKSKVKLLSHAKIPEKKQRWTEALPETELGEGDISMAGNRIKMGGQYTVPKAMGNFICNNEM